MEKQIRELPEIFEKKIQQLAFQQVKKTDKYYIYEVIDLEDNKLFSFEIFKRVIRPAAFFNNVNGSNEYTHYVVYPKDKDFGKFAWSCFNEERVHTIEQKIINGEL